MGCPSTDFIFSYEVTSVGTASSLWAQLLTTPATGKSWVRNGAE